MTVASRLPVRPACAVLAFLCAGLAPVVGLGRQGAPPPSRLFDLPSRESVDSLALPSPDVERLLREDAAEQAAGPAPYRFADAVPVLVTPDLGGTWATRADGSRVWRLRVLSPGATDLSFGFTRFRLPPGATLHVVTADERLYEGPYGAADNEDHGQLWTPVLPGDEATVELFVPASPDFEPELELGKVGLGYRDFHHALHEHEPKNHGGCNIDVVCPEGDPWRDQIRSVAVYGFGASRSCTGNLIADVPGTLRPWFLTADHCMNPGDAPSMVVYWNHQTSTCDGPEDGPLDQNQTGATFRAAWRPSDLMLVELDDDPDPAFDVYYSGWDATGAVPPGSVAIHHPRTHSKSISFNDDALTKVDSCIGTGGVDSHWRVNNWEMGTTEGGSSGSGIWDPSTGLLVGTLSGGGAACGNMLSDCYGAFDVHWTGGGDDDSRLSNWLDPAGTGTMMVPGSNAGLSVRYAGHAGTDSCALGAGDANGLWEPGEEIQLVVSLEATDALTGVTGVLSSPTAGVNIVDDTAGWPDFAGAGTQDSLAPHFTVSLEAGFACFEPIEFRLTVTGDDFTPTELAFSQVVGDPLRPDVPQGITDASPTVSSLVVADAFTMTDVDVRVVIDHSWIGDLVLTLESPSGTLVTLLDQPGEPAGTSCRDDDMDVTFDDDATFDPEDHCAGDDPWYVGDALPVDALAAFVGEGVEGTWLLRVTDEARFDDGTLVSWELLTTPPISAGTCVPCTDAPCEGAVIATTDLRVAKRAGDEVELRITELVSACAEGVAVRRATTARPGSAPGSFPDDPDFAAAPADLDPDPLVYRHAAEAGTFYYLAVESLPAGALGPSGHYGN